VSDARVIFNFQKENAPLKRTPTLNEVGGSALYLLSDLSGAVTGEVHFVDCGYSTVAMPNLETLKVFDAEAAARTPGGGSPSEAAE
jgi:enoyl-[acyl-carrier protein] reductase I